MFITITEFFGRLHPVLVHLPIGILLIACLLQWLSSSSRFGGLEQAISVTFFCGMLAAILSGISGYLLSNGGDYDPDVVSTHQWLGIATAVVSIALYWLHRRRRFSVVRQGMSIVLVLLVIFTGHYGGSLTHGSDYLSFSIGEGDEIERKPIPNVQEAQVYSDIVQPLLQQKCYSCHGKNKQKGGLRMDDSVRLLKGGKEGIVLVAGNADESEMIKRMMLPRNHEDHMPPKEKPQLTEQEIALLHWWIASGAPFNKKVKELQQPEKIKPALTSLQNASTEVATTSDVPTDEVSRADEKAVAKIKERGIVVLPVAESSNYLMVNFVTADSVTDEDIALLTPLKQQLVWLKLGSTGITDSALTVIGKMKNLTRLQLNNTAITDAGIKQLGSLERLQYLNLVGTKVTATGILALKDLKALQSLYLYQTLVTPSEWVTLKKTFSSVNLDSGGYIVPILPGDTTEVTQQKISN